ncbi:transcriptional regulator [Alicyclobacillus fastidiosus]|nr:transcriptional regulator [Alicyclobacillus fastidiosus]
MAGDGHFGTFLRQELDKANLSMRKLAKLCGLDPSIISRLVSGKQQPRPEHLSKIAEALQIPSIDLWRAAGYEISDDLPSNGVGAFYEDKAPSPIADQLRNLPFPEIENLDVNHIMAELQKYRTYASTAEGKTVIENSFQSKVEQVSGVGPLLEKLNVMYRLYVDEETEPQNKQLIGSALLYFILATDIIPDYMFPLGYLDDAIAIDIVWKELQASTKLVQ